MKLSDLEVGELFSFDVRAAEGVPFSDEMNPGCEITIEQGSSENEALLRFGPRAWAVEGSSAQQHQDLLAVLRDYPGRLCWITDCKTHDSKKWQLGVQLHGFVSFLEWPSLQIGIDEKLVQQIRRRHLNNAADIEDACLWLTKEALMPMPDSDGTSRIIVLGEDKTKPFAIHAKNIVLDVQVQNDKLLATAIRPARRSQQRRPTILVQGEVTFADASIIASLSTDLRTQIEQESRRSEAYLNLWREYNKLEREAALRKAQQFGCIRYHQQPTPLPNGNWSFRVDSDSGFARQLATLRSSRDVALEAAVQIPPEILGIDSEQPGKTTAKIEPEKQHFLGTFVGRSEVAMEIAPHSIDDVESRPPAEGFIYISLHGDISRLGRRDQAQALISSRLEPMHLKLSAILLGIELPVPRRGVHTPMSKGTRQVFHGTPTARQEEALRIALNTPDIALIQGPPGTGKTQVIAALNTRLAEITKDRLGISGTVLVSSFQHEAVKNAVSKINVLGLPAVKIGGKHLRDSHGGSAQETSQWGKEKIEQIRSTLHETATVPKIELDVQNLAIRYSLAPVPPAQAAILLDDVLIIAAAHLSEELKDAVSDEIMSLRRLNAGAFNREDDSRDSAMQAVRGLRIEATSFEDDGARNASKALLRLRPLGILAPEQESILEEAAKSDNGSFTRFAELSECKALLLQALVPKRIADGVLVPDPGVEAVFRNILDYLHEQRAGSPTSSDAVISQYLEDLRSDPEAVASMVRQYTVVLAATCQQAVSRQMLAVKTRTARPDIDIENQHRKSSGAIRFNSVLVDEAARANPLDLLIPMSLAQERIVLVGDHRQLPHILDPDIERELGKSLPEMSREALDKSLFERLFRLLKEREKKDGIRRTITLDTQYRMHRVLGDFVSQNFYEVHGEPAISAGREDSEFQHDLPGYAGKVAAWIDVPYAAGAEQGVQSKYRRNEADRLAQELKILMDSGSALTFGVITFYEAQRSELEKSFIRSGIGDVIHGGDFRPHSAYEGRLEYGTVDGFQGREFDIVLLSMTRSNGIDGEDEKALRNRFGHLMLENRLCVAMSRQKRLLIVVGDAGMLKGNAASSRIRGLVQFRQLCESEHGICI
jgi:hypothetical protein